MATAPSAPVWLDVPADADALDSRIWPAGAGRDEAGGMTLAGVPAADLARRFGTPLYVVDEDVVRDRASRIRRVFDEAFGRIGANVSVYYAGKAFLSTDVVRWVIEAGLHVDVCSGGELAVALAAGADPAILGFHGNNKSDAELRRATEVGVGTIVIDSPDEIERVAAFATAAGRRQNVRLRVNSGVHAHTHAFLATAHEDQKFGVPLESAVALVAAIRAQPSLRFLGLHCHIGSQIFDAAGFAESAHRLITVHAELLADGDVPELNLGGGFGIAYTTADTPADIDDIARGMASAVEAECSARGIPVPRIAIEPGRWIVGPAGVTLYEVGTVKPVPVEGGERLYVSVDGGMSDNARRALYEADYAARIASRVSGAAPALSRVVGKHCEAGDIVVEADYLPSDIRRGDLLAVAATGAYCYSLASNYNYLERPAVVAVRDGEARVLVRRETPDDLLARDTGVARTDEGARA
ncbi:diaminopimelate decarboxylase [Agromyces atrinae]|uniref:diaminopimelate decarboxylase n=1 Tax=Agromyces atrinae TaxID=592376 RepID=UPI001F57ACDA|nr:diaminopimelate decarboxylase [Agromyces atrinae]MCI2958118.1 diaminopimelate decarboxylase [Agromyces atrinae]